MGDVTRLPQKSWSQWMSNWIPVWWTETCDGNFVHAAESRPLKVAQSEWG